jgi:hypothetical protein
MNAKIGQRSTMETQRQEAEKWKIEQGNKESKSRGSNI